MYKRQAEQVPESIALPLPPLKTETIREETLPTPVFSSRFDWIKLTSDEWLKGDILSMYEEELEFDSDELGILKLDWDKIAEMRTKGIQSIRIIDGTVLEGWISMSDGILTLTRDGQDYEYEMDSVLSVASAQSRRRDLWDGDISIGANISRGNAENLDFTVAASIQRRSATSRFKANWVSNFSQNTDTETGEENETANNQRFTVSHDMFVNDKIFFRPADIEYFSDTFQNIDSRISAGIAVGYHIFNEKKYNWDVTAGPSYQVTTFSNVQALDSKDEKSGALALTTTFDYEITKDIDFETDYQIQFVSEDAGKYIHHLEVGLEMELVNDFDLDLIFYLDRTENPRKDENDNTPQKQDYRLVVSIGYNF